MLKYEENTATFAHVRIKTLIEFWRLKGNILTLQVSMQHLETSAHSVFLRLRQPAVYRGRATRFSAVPNTICA